MALAAVLPAVSAAFAFGMLRSAWCTARGGHAHEASGAR